MSRRLVRTICTGIRMKALRNALNSIRSSAPFSAACRAAHRPVSGKHYANQAFNVQASAAITMYAPLLNNVSTGMRVAPTPCFS